MYNKKPPFEITNAMLDEIAEIAELVGAVLAERIKKEIAGHPYADA